ncbi:MAG: hypothetical protein P1P90_03160 [Patescibacteria group bacterium]|nr:hypothetical protein [Patescibacteria group bacterium]
MSELIHIPNQQSKVKPDISNPFEISPKVSSEDVYGECEIDAPWNNMAEFKENLNALPNSTHQIIFGTSLEEVAKQTEEDSRLAEIFSSLRDLTPAEKANDTLKNNSIETNKEIISAQLQAYLSNADFFRPWYGMDVRNYWIEKLERGTTVEELSEEVKEWMNDLWNNGNVPFYNAEEAQEISEGYQQESKQSLETVRTNKIEREALQSKHWALPKGKRKQRADLERQINALYANPRLREREELGVSSDRKAKAWQQIRDNAQFIEALFKGIKSKVTPEDFTDIWLRSARSFERNKYRHSDTDSRLAEAFLQGIVKWLEDTDQKDRGTSKYNIEETERRLTKKIKLLKEQFTKLYNYLKVTKHDDESMKSSIHHTQQVLRILLKAIDDLSKLQKSAKKK